MKDEDSKEMRKRKPFPSLKEFDEFKVDDI